MIRLLHLEDSARDARMIQVLLDSEDGNYEITRAADRSQFEVALQQPGYDLIICDFNLPDFDGLSALKQARIRYPETPVIIVSGAIDAGEAGECLKSGATDYLLKQRLERLPSAVKRALEETAQLRERRQAQQKLEEKEKLLSKSQRIAHVGSYQHDLATNRVTWTEETFRIYGVAPETFVPSVEALMDLVHPDDRSGVQAQFGRSLAGESREPIEFRIVRASDGATRTVASHWELTGAKTGPGQFITGTVQDITERKQAAAREAAHLHRLRRLSELSMRLASDNPDAVFEDIVRMIAELFEVPVVCTSEIVDRNLQFKAVYLNGQVHRDAGGCPLDITPCATVETTKDIRSFDRVQERFPQAAFLRAHNANAYCGVPSLNAQGGVVAVTCLLDDQPREFGREDQELLRLIAQRIAIEMERGQGLAERRRAEHARLQAEAQYRQLFEHIPSGVFQTTPDGRFLAANPSLARLYGYASPAELITGLSNLQQQLYVQPERRKEFARLMTEHGQVTGFESEVTRKDGSRIWISETARAVHDSQGNLLHYEGIVEDITARKQAHHQALRSQRLESLGTLAGGVAHDLNNALAPIMMSMELLRLQYPGEAPLVETIQGSARRAADMVKQLLTFAKGAEGARVIVQPTHLLKEMLDIMKGTFPKSITFAASIETGLPKMLGDATQLHQVLLNLCVNARDAMPNGGTLTLEAKGVEVDPVFASSIPDAKPGKFLVLRVRDTGTGIPPAILDRIFDPFFTTKAPDKGTGLGLSTVLGIVRGHGGFMQVYSQPGQGTTFAVYLPATEGSPVAEPETAAESVFQGCGETILIVDDEAEIRAISHAVLKRLNFTPLTATDGADAIMQVAEHRADLRAIITDMHMPHMDGLAFVRAIRRTLPDIPIVVASGRLDDLTAEEFKALDVTLHLNKPFTQGDLTAVLKTIFRKP